MVMHIVCIVNIEVIRSLRLRRYTIQLLNFESEKVSLAVQESYVFFVIFLWLSLQIGEVTFIGSRQELCHLSGMVSTDGTEGRSRPFAS